MSFYKSHAPKHREHTREVKLPELEGMKALRDEGQIPSRQWQEEVRRGKEFGLDCVDSIQDKTEISCFQRGELPHWSGINTFLKTPYLEDVRKVGEYDVAFVGVPFDIGTTYRAGTPVSYTHLDVYKRQLAGCPAWSRAITPGTRTTGRIRSPFPQQRIK